MIKYKTYQRNVRVNPGQQLHYTPGKGFWSGPVVHYGHPMGPGPAEPKSYQGPNGPYAPQVVSPRNHPSGVVIPHQRAQLPPDPYAALSSGEVDRRAGALAQGELDPQLAEARRQQAEARQNAIADEQAIKGFQTAAAGLISGIAPEISASYNAAGEAIGSLGTGVGGQIGKDLADQQASQDAFAASQGQTGGTSSNGETGNVVGMLGGVIPGTEFAQEGAGRAAAYAEQTAIPLNAGREELAARMYQARQDNDQYAQELINIAADYPHLKAQALQQLNQYELDKASAREAKRVDTANIRSQHAGDVTSARAERASERAAGYSAANTAAEFQYKWASLQFQTQKAAAAAKRAAAGGKRIDVQASKLLGHIVYKDGSEDPSIKVKQTAGAATDPRVKAQQNRAKAVQKARTGAYAEAKKSLGTPTLTDNDTLTVARTNKKQVGKYIADPSQKYGVSGGVFPPAYPGGPATTNNPARAQRKGGAANYAQAQAQVWASIGGDSLMARYNLSREQVMAIVNRQLAAAGWKKG